MHCSPWGCKELDTTWRLNNTKVMVNSWPDSVPFECKPTNSEPASRLPQWALILWPYTCRSHPRAREQTSRDGSYAPEPTAAIQTHQSSACLPCLVLLSVETTAEALPEVSLLPLPPDHPWCILGWTPPHRYPRMACPVLLGFVGNYLFDGRCLLICWP